LRGGLDEGRERRRRENRREVVFLLSMQDGIDICLSYQPNQPPLQLHSVHHPPLLTFPFEQTAGQPTSQPTVGGWRKSRK